MKIPVSLYRATRRPCCPVCGEVSYSRAGIHPQCAQKQADAKRMARLGGRAKAKRAAKPVKATAAVGLKAWHKRCPRCGTQIHIRKAACACGHDFQHQGSS